MNIPRARFNCKEPLQHNIVLNLQLDNDQESRGHQSLKPDPPACN